MSEKTKAPKKPLPTHEEVERMVHEAFPALHSMCPILCTEFENASDAVDNAPTPQAKAHALVRLRAISAQLRALHCQCTPQ
jgi:hypothetical protein